jgi:hypothetical protein
MAEPVQAMKLKFPAVIPFVFLLGALNVRASAAAFHQATPAWPETRGDDLNRRVGFRTVVDAIPAGAMLRVATSGLYRATVDGRFLGRLPGGGSAPRGGAQGSAL